MLEKLKALILFISAAIDSGKNSSITIQQISDAISKGDIFDFIDNRIQSPYQFSSKSFSKNEKEHLIASWQLAVEQSDFSGNFSIKNSGLCLLLAYTALSL